MPHQQALLVLSLYEEANGDLLQHQQDVLFSPCQSQLYSIDSTEGGTRSFSFPTCTS